MLSFHGDKSIKEKYLARVRAHQAADNLIRGIGWDGARGCAVGCTLESYNHKKYETELGIPEWLAFLEDELFENMSEEKSRTWPEEFLKAIPVGVNLDAIKNEFILVLLRHTLTSIDACQYDKKEFPSVENAVISSKEAVIEMIRCIESKQDTGVARSAASAAWSAASAARSAASAAWSAESAVRSAYDYYADELLRLIKEI